MSMFYFLQKYNHIKPSYFLKESIKKVKRKPKTGRKYYIILSDTNIKQRTYFQKKKILKPYNSRKRKINSSQRFKQTLTKRRYKITQSL